jgi:hypothetical protein
MSPHGRSRPDVSDDLQGSTPVGGGDQGNSADEEDAPAPREFASGWSIGKPDLVI